MQRTTALLACLLVLSTIATGPALAATEPAFVVTLHENGDAELSLITTFDLSGDADRQAFEELRNNETAKAAYASAFGEQVAAVARTTENATGREMTVRDASIEFATADSTGYVARNVTWENLAAVDGDRVTLSEPFASRFEPQRTFVVVVPDGYDVSVTPEPDARDGNRLTWSAGSDLTGFQLNATKSGTFGLGPGFGALGVLAAVVALLGGALLASRD